MNFILEEPCELYCSDINDTVIVPWGEHALDGTPCKVGSRDVCISGICRVSTPGLLENFSLLHINYLLLTLYAHYSSAY